MTRLGFKALDVTIDTLDDPAPRLFSLGVDNGDDIALLVVAATWIWGEILPHDANRSVLDRPRTLLNFAARDAIDNNSLRREVQCGLATLR